MGFVGVRGLMFGSKEYYFKEQEKIRIENNLEAIVEIIIEHSIKNIEEEKRLAKQHYSRDKYRRDEKYSLNGRISSTIWKSLRHNVKGKKEWEGKVGYTLKHLIKHLKKTIPERHTWQDFLNGKLHIDHIIPKNVFNFTDPEHIDFKRCWALQNLRLLPARENIKKGSKLSKPFQPALEI